MGAGDSKSKIRQLEEQQKVLMKQHAELAQRMADERAEAKRQNQAAFEQVAKMMVLVALAESETKDDRTEKKEIEIEGTTYQLLEYVNRGGFGEIYKAKVKNKNTIVAVKIMKYSKAIEDEVKNEIEFLRITKKITIQNHPVIEYYGSKVTADNIVIAMELAAVDLLNFWIDQASKGENEQLVVMGMIIIVYVLRALTFLERLNIIHGDIKPQNIVIVPNGEAFCIKLIDFGTVEKMNTQRAQLTVEASKSHTLFFVSPEFLKRDSKNLVSRHLHKKSDSWAAGVMFYLLFCGELPWKDQYDYENFCNNPQANDIVVPDIGGFKMIIDLLLKKNPNQRSSAKATLMQVKAHPTFGPVIDSLHQKFCPVDDVCHMDVPKNVREGLAKLARPGRVPSTSDSTASESSHGSRRPCRYGRGCYRKDSAHRQEYAHPVDSDYRPAEDLAYSGKQKCWHGSECYSADADHLSKFAHPTGSTKQRCRYGASCYNNDSDHRKQFSHLGVASSGQPQKEKCHFGDSCTKRGDRDHMAKYLHD